MALRGELDGDYYKGLGPTQLLAERGREVVVINPGSAFLRIGLASQKEPLVIPHCIACYWPAKPQEGISELDDTLLDRRRSSAQAGTSQKREEACRHVEAHLNIAPGWLQAASAKATSGLKLVPEADATGVQWTETRTTAVQVVRKTLKEELTEQANPETVAVSTATGSVRDGGSDTPKDKVHERRGAELKPEEGGRTQGEEATEASKGDADGSPQLHAQAENAKDGLSDVSGDVQNENGGHAGAPETSAPLEPKTEYRRWICGEEALHIAEPEPYVLRRPIRRGRLNVSSTYPLQHVCTDLSSIWHWAVSEKLRLSLQERRTMSAVLVLSETLHPREAKELLTIVLKDLHFESVVLHQESIAALFGNNMMSACIVSLGAQVCAVACIEEGTLLPNSRVSLPFGGEDVSRALLWVQQHYVHAWPYSRCDPVAKVQDRLLLEGLKEEHCFYGEGGHVATAEFMVRKRGASAEQYSTPLIGSPNLAPVGLFFPALLAPEEYPPPTESALPEDYEETLDDVALSEPGRRASEPLSNGGDAMFRLDEAMPLMGIDEAVVASILSTYSPDLQKKLFSSIQLVGGGARMAGVVDFMEERVLQTIPGHVDVDTVEVVKNRGDPRTLAWRGGCILGVLDYSEAWVQRDDWVEGGARAGSGRKYKDSNNLSTQTFWYCSTTE